MPQVPECLNRRYRALDEMIKNLSEQPPTSTSSEANVDPVLKMMCDFWNILKEDPHCDLPEQVQQYFGCGTQPSQCCFTTYPQRYACFMADSGKNPNEPQRGADKSHSSRGYTVEPVQDNEESRQFDKKDSSKGAGAASSQHSDGNASTQANRPADGGGAAPPLSKVMRDLRAAASVDNNCKKKMRELLDVERNLREEIKRLEDREKAGVGLMKQADEMWSDMEDSYKEKIAQSIERQNELMKQVQAIEKSASKWKKNKKDLESQLDSISKCQNEIVLKISQKTNDLKTIKAEIEGFKKRIKAAEEETETSKKLLASNRADSDARMAVLAVDMKKIDESLKKEKELKKKREQEGEKYIKEARENLQQLCKLLLQKKLEEEDYTAEKYSLIEEINLLKDSCDNCREKCKQKQISLNTESKRLDAEIKNYELKCIQCNQCIDTGDVRKFCIDCPRCLEKRQCLMADDSCGIDAAEECVCQYVKEKFLDNVFDNMYTILERQIRSDAGKALADEIARCLRNSRNGKLNERTRRILQEFILSSVKKKLNLTIVGGAVKTRCELDSKTYNQLMVCLTSCKVSPVPKQDKGVDVKRDPCKRWGGPKECNCPKGPNACICTRKAPPPPRDPKPCPEPTAEDPGETVICPHKPDKTCGPECGAHLPDRVSADVAKYRQDPCSSTSCNFGNNMRAAQCVLGPDALEIDKKPGLPCMADLRIDSASTITCKCNSKGKKPCTCPKDNRNLTRLKIIEEVMGRYNDAPIIDTVASVNENTYLDERKGFRDGSKSRINRIHFSSSTLDVSGSKQIYHCSSTYTLDETWRKQLAEKERNVVTTLYRDIKSGDSYSEESEQDDNQMKASSQITAKISINSTAWPVSKCITKSTRVIDEQSYNVSKKEFGPNTTRENTCWKKDKVTELEMRRSPLVEWVPVTSILNKLSPFIPFEDLGLSKSIPKKTHKRHKKGRHAKHKNKLKHIESATKKGLDKVRVVVNKNIFQNIFDTGKIQKGEHVKLISNILKKNES